jgi:hypothetical protein
LRCFHGHTSVCQVTAHSHSIQIHCILSQGRLVCRVLTDVDIVQQKAMVFGHRRVARLDDEKCFFFQTDQEGYMENCTETLFMQHITRPLLPQHPLSFHSRLLSLTHGTAWHGSFQHLSSIVQACALCQQLQQSPDHLYLCHRVRTRQGR